MRIDAVNSASTAPVPVLRRRAPFTASLVAFVAPVCLVVTAAAYLPDGPPPGHTGGFGEPTCAACHEGGADPGTPPARIELRAPATFVPGRTYDIVVTVRRAALERAGFQLAARFAAGDDLSGRQAGSLAPRDSARVSLVRDTATGVWYARHTLAGNAANGAGRWVVRWTAPAEARQVSFHAAALAANDDNSNFGDEVLTAAAAARPAVR